MVDLLHLSYCLLIGKHIENTLATGDVTPYDIQEYIKRKLLEAKIWQSLIIILLFATCFVGFIIMWRKRYVSCVGNHINSQTSSNI